MSDHDTDKLRVLFICTGNACRSQMAEGWATALKSDCIDAYSAGTRPAGTVSSRVVQVMKEAGVDLSTHWSKPIAEWDAVEFDYVVTLCDNARDQCAASFKRPVKRLHYPVPDPMGIMGSDELTLDAFRRTRDRIKALILSMPEMLK